MKQSEIKLYKPSAACCRSSLNRIILIFTNQLKRITLTVPFSEHTWTPNNIYLKLLLVKLTPHGVATAAGHSEKNCSSRHEDLRRENIFTHRSFFFLTRGTRQRLLASDARTHIRHISQSYQSSHFVEEPSNAA